MQQGHDHLLRRKYGGASLLQRRVLACRQSRPGVKVRQAADVIGPLTKTQHCQHVGLCLSNVLGKSQHRGQWGDDCRACGCKQFTDGLASEGVCTPNGYPMATRQRGIDGDGVTALSIGLAGRFV